MIRFLSGRIRTWVRPSWFLPVMAAGYLLFEVMYLRLLCQHPLANRIDLQGSAGARDSLMLLFVAMAGVLRANSYHPLSWIDYGRWLMRTPWRVPKPLPLGNIYLAFDDVVLLAITVFLLHEPYINLLRVPLYFLTGYLAASCMNIWLTESKGYAYALAFGLGGVVRLCMSPLAALAVAVLLYPIAYLGLRRSLMGFPWSKPGLLSTRHASIRLTLSTDLGEWIAQRPSTSLGWPFDFLRPNQPSSAISWSEGVAVSLLLGWWLYAIAGNPIEPEAREGLLMAGLFVIPAAMAIVRIKRYRANYRSPIGRWGRLLTLRWLVPGYDKIFFAPLSAVALPWFGGLWMISQLRLDPLAAVPVAVACASMIALNLGPTLQDWRHTGNHRILPKYDSKTHLRL